MSRYPTDASTAPRIVTIIEKRHGKPCMSLIYSINKLRTPICADIYLSGTRIIQPQGKQTAFRNSSHTHDHVDRATCSSSLLSDNPDHSPKPIEISSLHSSICARSSCSHLIVSKPQHLSWTSRPPSHWKCSPDTIRAAISEISGVGREIWYSSS